MRYLSLCSGIEAATVAWHPMGWEPAAFAEIEAFPAAVLKHHYPHTPNLGDMTKWREWNVGAIDLLVGGTPCQSFSVAGLRKGLSDPRGGLMLTFLEIAQSLRPRWVVWENVPGVLSSGGGRDFGSFLGALGELGYGWAYRVLDAQWCRVDGYERAVPQRRRRVFVVGCLGDATRAAQVLFERQSVERNPAPRRAKGQGAAADAEGGVGAGGCYWDGSNCAATLTRQNASGAQRMPDMGNFGAVLQPAWPAEVCSTLNASFGEKQGLEDQHALGGAPCFVPVLQPAWPAEVAPTLTQAGKGTGAPGFSNQEIFSQGCASLVPDNAVPFRKSHRASSATDDESWVRAETANTLNRFDTGERDTHAIAFKPGQSAQARSLGAQDEVACTLEAGGGGNNRQAVAFTQNQREEVRELGPVTGALSGQGTHQTTYIAATIDMQACKGNANIGDGSVSPTLCKPSGSDVHATAFAQNQLGEVRASEIANTLNTNCNASGRNTPMAAVAFTPGNLKRGAGPSPNSEVAPTQKCSAGRGADDQRTCVAFTCKDYGADAGDVAPTLRAMPHDGSHPNGGGQVAVAVSFDWQKGNDVGNPRPSTMNIAEEHSMTLGTTRVPAVAHGFYSTGGTHGVNMEPEVSPAVKVGSGLGIPSPPAVAFKPSHFTRGKDGSPTNITPPLSADADKGDQDTVVAYPIDGRNAMRDPEKHDEINRQGVGVGNAGDPSHTVTSAAVHAVAAIAPSLTASNDPSRSPQSAEVTQQIAAVHEATMVVRRLTPIECERLQGFPDDYTNIPWRGKPESPDGPRYKALGNSMAVNCMRWIGRRIDAVEKGTELPQ